VTLDIQFLTMGIHLKDDSLKMLKNEV